MERDDGQWDCQHGLTVFDSHPELSLALDHLRETAAEFGHRSEFFVHRRTGEVRTAEL